MDDKQIEDTIAALRENTKRLIEAGPLACKQYLESLGISDAPASPPPPAIEGKEEDGDKWQRLSDTLLKRSDWAHAIAAEKGQYYSGLSDGLAQAVKQMESLLEDKIEPPTPPAGAKGEGEILQPIGLFDIMDKAVDELFAEKLSAAQSRIAALEAEKEDYRKELDEYLVKLVEMADWAWREHHRIQAHEIKILLEKYGHQLWWRYRWSNYKQSTMKLLLLSFFLGVLLSCNSGPKNKTFSKVELDSAMMKETHIGWINDSIVNGSRTWGDTTHHLKKKKHKKKKTDTWEFVGDGGQSFSTGTDYLFFDKNGRLWALGRDKANPFWNTGIRDTSSGTGNITAYYPPDIWDPKTEPVWIWHPHPDTSIDRLAALEKRVDYLTRDLLETHRRLDSLIGEMRRGHLFTPGATTTTFTRFAKK